MIQFDKEILIATSWDDGLASDLRLVEILKKYNATATFGLNPGLYSETRILNDNRHIKYGYKITKSELHHFMDYDIWNHTDTHKEMNVISRQQMLDELRDGKKKLEDIFQRNIDGIIWPYGSYTNESIDAALETGHRYGRATPIFGAFEISRWATIPLHWRTWQIGIDYSHIVISGHTYEMVTEDDWLLVDELYRTITNNSNYKLVTLTELMESCLTKSISIHSRPQDA